MRDRSSATRTRSPPTEIQHSIVETVLVAALVVAAVPFALYAVESPLTAAAAAGAAVVAARAGRTLLRLRRGGRRRTVCIPHTSVCVGV